MEAFYLNRYVYLSDLDSVCNSQEEIKYALDKTLYENIVLNGDIVVLSFNQLADSNFIISFLNDNVMKEVLINLFECGRIVVSKYKSKDIIISSAVRYIMQQIDKQIKSLELSENNDFIFSAINCLNIENNKQKIIILTILKETLIYNDLNYLCKELGSKSLSNEIDISENDILLLKNYAEFLVRISLGNISYIDEKTEKITKFTECVDIACSALKSTDLDVYKELSALKGKISYQEQSRSKWIKEHNKNIKGLQEVEAVINTCYNLAVESSISTIISIDDTEDKEKYFLKRYNQILNNYQLNNHQYFSSKQKDELYEFTDTQREYWESAIRIIKNENFNNNSNSSWQENIKEYRTARKTRYFVVWLLTLSILYFSGQVIDVTLDTFNGYVSISGIILDIIAIIFGDAVGYFLKVSNLIELFLDKKQRFDMRNCNNIVKHKYYDKEVPKVYVANNNR